MTIALENQPNGTAYIVGDRAQGYANYPQYVVSANPCDRLPSRNRWKLR